MENPDFCNDIGSFLNLTQLWWTDIPDVGLCFERIVLALVPPLLFWICFPFEICRSPPKCRGAVYWSPLSVARIVLLGVLFLISLSEFLRYVSLWFLGQSANGTAVTPMLMIAPFVHLLTFGAIIHLHIWHHKKSIYSSLLLWFTWLLFIVCCIFEVQTLWRQFAAGVNVDRVHTVLITINYVSYVALLILFSFALQLSSESARVVQPPELDQTTCPEPYCSVPNRLFFHWFNQIVQLGYQRTLTLKDLFMCNVEEQSCYTVPRFMAILEREFQHCIESKRPSTATDNVEVRRNLKPSLVKVIIKFCWRRLLLSFFINFSETVFMFISPQILGLLILYTGDDSEPYWHGYLYAAMLLVAQLLLSLSSEHGFYIATKIAVQIKSALVAAVYRKSLKLTAGARQKFTAGEIMNFMGVDAARIEDGFSEIHALWECPLQVLIALLFLYQLLGVAALAGFAVMVLFVPLNAAVFSFAERYQDTQMEHKDSRMKLINEVLNGIKVIKLYAWEPAFLKQVTNTRNSELKYLKKGLLAEIGIELSFSCTPLLVSVVTFVTYVLMSSEHVLTPQKAFVAVSLFSLIELPLSAMPMVIVGMIQVAVSVKRLRRFFSAEELSDVPLPLPLDPSTAVHIRNASFAWDSTQPTVLHDINLKIGKGQLIGVVGAVGSGKSSLLSAICSELQKLSGSIAVDGTLAYVPQLAWIQNLSMRDNVLFSRPFLEERYWATVKACALEPDFELLQAGDMTEIGERGVTLSGGQKQRTSLARAVYQDSDIYLLDDPLSAVDVHVGKQLFSEVIGPNGLLKNKTRILVTHHLRYLPNCDLVVMMQDGKIMEMGQYTELLDKEGLFTHFLVSYMQEAHEEEKPDLDEMLFTVGSPIARRTLERRISESQPEPGSLRRSTSSSAHVSRLSESLPGARQRRTSRSSRSPSVTRLSENLPTAAPLGPRKRTASLLSTASSDSSTSLDSTIQAMLAGANTVDEEEIQIGRVPFRIYWSYLKSAGMCRVGHIVLIALAYACVSASSIWLALWTDNVDAVMRNQTNDSMMDTNFAIEVYSGIAGAQVLFTLVGSWIAIYSIVRASRKIHKNLLMGILRAPMNFFERTPIGRIINRFGKDIDVMDNELPENLNEVIHEIFFFLCTMVNILYAIPIFAAVAVPILFLYYFVLRYFVATSRQLRRLESVSRSPIFEHFAECLHGVDSIRAYKQQARFIIAAERLVDYNNTAYVGLWTANRWLGIRLGILGDILIMGAAVFAVWGRNNDLSPGLVGLCVAYAMDLTEELAWGVKRFSQLETEIVALERIEDYSKVPSEAAWESAENSRPPDDWPRHGMIEFRGYSTRYRPGLDLVLRDVNFRATGGQRIGVVGRTGAGKSSLTLALFRLIEPVDGSILIDGINIGNVGLHDVRSRLTIIPQDPVMFTGSVRLNLDPFLQHSDEDLWRVLEVACLKNYVSNLREKLQEDIAEGGANLSVGQRQLLCLARALLRKSKVLIMDEATAAVDPQTDQLIQQTVRTHFHDCTVLTIAHRLQTIMDSHRILVLEEGKVKEFATPQDLLRNPDSLFSKMVAEAGLKS